MLVDQILIEKITEFNISQVYYFYLSFNSTDLMYYLNYKIWTNQLNAEGVIEKFYKDDLILDSFVIDEELFLFLQNKTFLTIYSISNEQINLREKLNFSQVQLSHQIKVYRDFLNFFQIMVNQYNNFELNFNSADQSKIQITKTSRNPRLVCAQKAGQQHSVSLFENISEMNLYYSKEILISAYLKYNSTRLEVIFEEFDYRESISDEIRISNDADYLVVKKQPKVIKKGFYYFISYLTQQITGLYQRDLVILNDAYQQCSRNIIASVLSAESDVYVTDILSIYFFSIYTNHTEKYLRLQYYQFLNGNIQEQSNWQGYNEYNDEVQFKNLRFGSTQINSVVPLLFTSIKDGIEIDHFITFDVVHQTLSGSVNHTYLQQYQNGFQYQTVLYDIINSTQVNLQFFNDNQVFQKEYIILYYIQLASSQNLINKSYRALLNHQLQQIPIYFQICSANCKKCDLTQQCTLCHIGYYLDLKPICSNDCQKCSIPYTCEYCKGNLKYIDKKCQEVQKQNQEQQICNYQTYFLHITIIIKMVTFSMILNLERIKIIFNSTILQKI